MSLESSTHLPARPFLTARWQWLLMLNYEVPPELVLSYVPRDCELDFWQDRTFVSLVGFLFLDTRVRGLAIPGYRNFEEVNLRLYVRRRGPEGWRRGVVFVKEIVPRRAIATLARLLYNENYVTRPMRHEVALASGLPATGSQVAYHWRTAGQWQHIAGVVAGQPAPLTSGSEPEFIAEHYWGYARARDGGTTEYRVEHPPWRVWNITSPTVAIDVAREYGPQFAAPLSAPPASAFLAEGSPIAVYPGARIA